jgi:hypothetical protein
MLGVIDRELGWKSDYVKFRVSDNNNSADASTFHRDIIAQNGTLPREYLPKNADCAYLSSEGLRGRETISATESKIVMW